MNDPSIFSFFTGAGFLDLGFENEHFNVVYVNESHKPFTLAYKHSRKILGKQPPKYGYDITSIEHISAEILSANIDQERRTSNLVGFIGGPPCPDFSVGGKNRGRDGDNGILSKVYVDLICKQRPDFFLFENVKGLYRTRKHREFFEQLKQKLLRNGYFLSERLINSIEYGAPQDRDRIILLGFKRENNYTSKVNWVGQTFPDREAFSFPWPDTNEFEADKILPAPDSVPIKLTVQHWFEKNAVSTHANAEHCFTPRAGLPRFLSVKEGDDKKKSYKRLHRWRYSPTAAYGNNEVHLHPYKARRLTVAEALAIQSLPRKFELPPEMTLSDMFKTIGNGVPYLAARGLAKTIRNHLEGNHASNSSKLSACD